MVWSHPQEQTETVITGLNQAHFCFFSYCHGYRLMQIVALQEAGWDFEYERRHYCRVLDLFEKVCEDD